MCKSPAPTCSPADCCNLALIREVHIHCAVAQRMGYSAKIHVKGSGVALPEEATRILRKLRTFAQNEHDLEHQANLYVQWWHAAYHTTGTDIYDSLLEDMDRKFPSPTPATSFLTMETFAAAEKKSEKSDREEETATPKRKGSRMAKNVFIHSALGPILGSDACDDGRHSGIWGKVSQHLHFV
eukprot:comp22078_c0_seq1/m.32179 comp22078_c0_seq1/g.32179  ORF comp22078_c0_seq1/g.32179 comp22078_c0_seq1/m.32179 type:complete len:183 (-) comp22078_c0_seq1:520-1068(-)